MAQHTSDEPILAKITNLGGEEQRLYGQGELADHDQVRLEKIKVELDQVGICFVNAMRNVNSATIPTRRSFAPPLSSNGTSNKDRNGRRGAR